MQDGANGVSGSEHAGAMTERQQIKLVMRQSAAVAAPDPSDAGSATPRAPPAPEEYATESDGGDHRCAFCGGGETDADGDSLHRAGALLGPLSIKRVGGGQGAGRKRRVYVHYRCALWSPKVKDTSEFAERHADGMASAALVTRAASSPTLETPPYVHDFEIDALRGGEARGGAHFLLGSASEVRRSRGLACAVCGRGGASIGCAHNKCRRTYHYCCAQDAGCVFLYSRAGLVGPIIQPARILVCPHHRQSMCLLPAATASPSSAGAAAARAIEPPMDMTAGFRHWPLEARESLMKFIELPKKVTGARLDFSGLKRGQKPQPGIGKGVVVEFETVWWTAEAKEVNTWQESETLMSRSLVSSFWRRATREAQEVRVSSGPRAMSLDRACGKAKGDNDACCVCGSYESVDGNPIIFCDGRNCNVAVHLACYGLWPHDVPEGDDPWFCYSCRTATAMSAPHICPAELLKKPVACRRCNLGKYSRRDQNAVYPDAGDMDEDGTGAYQEEEEEEEEGVDDSVGLLRDGKQAKQDEYCYWTAERAEDGRRRGGQGQGQKLARGQEQEQEQEQAQPPTLGMDRAVNGDRRERKRKLASAGAGAGNEEMNSQRERKQKRKADKADQRGTPDALIAPQDARADHSSGVGIQLRMQPALPALPDDGVTVREFGISKLGKHLCNVSVKVLSGARALMHLPSVLDFGSRVTLDAWAESMAHASSRTICSVRLTCSDNNNLEPAQAARWTKFVSALLEKHRAGQLQLHSPQAGHVLCWYTIPTSETVLKKMQHTIGTKLWQKLMAKGKLPQPGLGAWGVLLREPA